ncbi:MAG TPA: M17 family peptidase N-terminal domain-containing protein, partial [Gammaproteobacteria bacterium]|nr:M17 family peptidase N-terminal domain-containing protein [Gammaproteobacteria bacterium]
MEFSVKSGHPEKQRSACLVVGVFEPRRLSDIAEKLDKISDGYISNLLRRGDLEGKIGQVLLLHNVPGTLSDRVLLVGCGKERELGDAQYIKIIKTVVKTLNETGAMEAVSFLPNLNIKGRDIHWKLMKAVQATHDELYEFTELKSKKSEARRPLRRMIFILPTRRDLTLGEKAIQEGLALSNGVNITKYLADLPANICTPTYLADKALEFEKKYSTISTAILEEKDMRALKMGALLAVTRGSHQPAKLITMAYRGAQKESKPIVLVGKGITFDTGGISLKNPQAIMGMKYDMCGAATIFGVFEAVA